MAVFDRIEYFGIAVDRDISIPRARRNRRQHSTSSSDISLSLVEVDELSITATPWFFQPNQGDTKLTPSSPSNSPFPLVPEQHFVVPVSNTGELLMDGSNVWHNSRSTTGHDALAPLERFIQCAERHEKIAVSLAADARYELPYQDYMPCPGSGPGSGAVSVATKSTRPSQIGRPEAVGQAHSLLPQLTTLPVESPKPVEEGPIMMRRYLADLGQEPNWLSVVLEHPQPHPETREERHDGPPADRIPQHETFSSVSLRPSCEQPPKFGSSTKRPFIECDEVSLDQDGYEKLVPDEELAKTYLYRLRSEAFKERTASLQDGSRPRRHKVTRVHKKRPRTGKEDGSSSPLSATDN
ncbi:hypothetical protein B0H66DRAFT_14536 [Apodospora peruviana]|uniref:Uncharacterized protein n=1 Tax=Apodospora peruviana TaxID=516989 RepID=A0AAE0ME25_9PEZI|nr:hypothetical protein B0H66DRAFT_14536 [Apodospora peruviana]